MLALADAWDAMTTERAYQQASTRAWPWTRRGVSAVPVLPAQAVGALERCLAMVAS